MVVANTCCRKDERYRARCEQMIDADDRAFAASANSLPRLDRRRALKKSQGVPGGIACRIDRKCMQAPGRNVDRNAVEIEFSPEQRAQWRAIEHGHGTRRAATADQDRGEPAHAVRRHRSEVRLVDMAHFDVAPQTQKPCDAAAKTIRVGAKQRRVDGAGRCPADHPERQWRCSTEYARDGAQHANLIGRPRTPAGKYDTRLVRRSRHAEALLGAQGTIENHQHRCGCAPDVALTKRNREVVAADLSQHSKMTLLVRWVKQKRQW